MDQPTLQAVFGQPPRKAIAYLEQKKVIPSEDWWQVQGNAHNHAFVVAHMSRLDLLEVEPEGRQHHGVLRNGFNFALAGEHRARLDHLGVNLGNALVSTLEYA